MRERGQPEGGGVSYRRLPRAGHVRRGGRLEKERHARDMGSGSPWTEMWELLFTCVGASCVVEDAFVSRCVISRYVRVRVGVLECLVLL